MTGGEATAAWGDKDEAKATARNRSVGHGGSIPGDSYRFAR
jgi:hypothetical protein